MSGSVSQQPQRIAVMTSGGDAPGMNSAIRTVVRYARYYGIETFGIYRGFQGLVNDDIRPLRPRDVGGQLQEGGTFLMSARLPEFRQAEVQRRAVDVLRAYDIDGLVVIGGDGSMAGAAALHQQGFTVAGVPASIDNDIVGTDMAIGVDTALNTILWSIDRLRDTASSHGRVFVVETMGRSSGYLTLMAGLTGGAEVVHIPEVPLTLEAILEGVEQGHQRGKSHVIVMVAEGAEHKAEAICDYIEARHQGYEPRATILGHVQRGGRPSHFDRLLATRLGAQAIDALREGETGVMAAVSCDRTTTVPLADVVGRVRRAPVDEYELIRILAQ